MSEQLWQGGAWEHPQSPVQPLVLPKVRKKQRRPSKRKGWVVFSVFLALILVLGILAVAMSCFELYYVVDYGPYVEQEQEKTKETTVPRGGVGGTTRMELKERGEQVLTEQEIYEKCSPAIVYVQVLYPSGRRSAGSGVVLSEDGYILTNAHVLEGTQKVLVLFQDNTVLEAQLVGLHSDYDLAVLKVEGSGLPCAQFANSDELQVGDTVVAIGNPLGSRLRCTMTEGIVSAINRSVDLDGVTMSLIQTTAALNPGNSGGALINDRGQVVGITTMKMVSRYETIEGLGFAVPTRLAKAVVDSIIASGEAKTPVLGITVVFNYVKYGGLYVSGVNKNSDAWAKGLRPEDVIVAVNGVPMTDESVLILAKENLGVGGSLTLTVQRGEEELEMEVLLMDAALFEQK